MLPQLENFNLTHSYTNEDDDTHIQRRMDISVSGVSHLLTPENIVHVMNTPSTVSVYNKKLEQQKILFGKLNGLNEEQIKSTLTTDELAQLLDSAIHMEPEMKASLAKDFKQRLEVIEQQKQDAKAL